MTKTYILYENGNIDFFSSIKTLVNYIEIVDVKNNEYIFYDSEGQVLRAEIIANKITLIETENYEIESLVSKLKNFFRLANKNIESNSLKELVKHGLNNF